MENLKEVFSLEEIESAFNSMLLNKKRNYKSSYVLESLGYNIDGRNTSLLPVGVDGITTCHVLKSKESREQFLNEIYRLVNQFENDTEIPRLVPKKYKIKEIESVNGKKRKVLIPCLRDQVVVKCILNRLNTIGITDEENKPNQRIDLLTKRVTELIRKDSNKKIIRTDISNFYPSINRELLIEKLRQSHEELISTPIINLIEKFINKNKSCDCYTGLPVGVGICVLLANYYVSQLNLTKEIPNAEIIRYEDDFLLIADESVDEKAIMSDFDRVLNNFNLKRNPEKTKFFNACDEFDFLGVSFKNSRPYIPEERYNRWKKSVKEDIKKQFRELKIMSLVNQSVSIPKNKEIVDTIWKDHKRGLRSKFYQHRMRINNISGS
jgi:hypothetical protein